MSNIFQDEKFVSSIYDNRQIKSLNKHIVIQIACGGHHNLALLQGMYIISFVMSSLSGSNTVFTFKEIIKNMDC